MQEARRDREGTDAREHDAVAPGDPLSRIADQRLGAGGSECALDAAQVADPVVTDSDHGAHSVPLVEGTPPPMTRNASRVARPRALNAASAM